jgi:hypothetical protein
MTLAGTACWQSRVALPSSVSPCSRRTETHHPICVLFPYADVMRVIAVEESALDSYDQATFFSRCSGARARSSSVPWMKCSG